MNTKHTESFKIGFIAAMLAALCTTLGHYFEFWVIAYGVAIIGGVVTAAVFSGDL